jgi:hypothetical protein
VRTVGTGSLVVGNLGFKMDATGTGDLGAERAITWLNANSAGGGLDADVLASGYYAASHDALDPTSQRTTQNPREVVDWVGDGCATVSGAFTSCLSPTAVTTIGQNSVSWVITRLCSTAGSITTTPGISCGTSLASGTVDDANSSALDYSSAGGLGVTTSAPYYRVIVRTVGARNTVSFTETIVHF